MNFEKLNVAARSENVVKKINTLKMDEVYTVISLKMVTTQYGGRVVVNLEGFGECFLPPRIYNFLNKDSSIIVDLEKQISMQKLGFKYLGGKYNAVEFTVL